MALLHAAWSTEIASSDSQNYSTVFTAMIEQGLSSPKNRMRGKLSRPSKCSSLLMQVDTILNVVNQCFDQLRLKSLSKEIGCSENRLFAFAEDVYLSAPIAVLPRHIRENVLNLVSAWILTGKDNTSNLSKHLSLMVKLMELPNASAKVVSLTDVELDNGADKW
jgi:hypothetical protein